MKTAAYFKNEILTLLTEISEGQHTKREINAVKKKIEHYKACKAYLESSPSQEFIEKEIARLEGFITAKLLEFDDNWGERISKLAKPQASKIRENFEAGYDIPHKRSQIKFLRYLLD